MSKRSASRSEDRVTLDPVLTFLSSACASRVANANKVANTLSLCLRTQSVFETANPNRCSKAGVASHIPGVEVLRPRLARREPLTTYRSGPLTCHINWGTSAMTHTPSMREMHLSRSPQQTIMAPHTAVRWPRCYGFRDRTQLMSRTLSDSHTSISLS